MFCGKRTQFVLMIAYCSWRMHTFGWSCYDLGQMPLQERSESTSCCFTC